MKILVYLEKSDVRGGIEIFAERHVARLRAEGHEVDIASDVHQEMGLFDEIIVHKCSDVATLDKFPPEKTVYYIHDHEPICPRTYAYTPLRRNCTRAGGVWPCILCAPLCRGWKSALRRVFAQGRRKRAMARFRRLVVISEFMKGRLVANGIPAEKIAVEPPVIRTGETGESVPRYPLPVPSQQHTRRVSAEVPLKSGMTLRLQGEKSFASFPYVTSLLAWCSRSCRLAESSGRRPDSQD